MLHFSISSLDFPNVAHALPSFWQLIDAATIYIPTSIVHLKKSDPNPFA